MKKFNVIDEKNEYIPYCQEAFIIKYHEGARHQRRQELLEIDRINPLIYAVEEMFYNAIFNTDLEYEEVYKHYLKLYEDVCDYIKEKKKMKFFKINKNYFYEQFAPRDTVLPFLQYEEFGKDPAKDIQ